MTAVERERRVEEVFRATPGNQKVLMETMEACRVPRTPSELDELMGEVLRSNRSVYGPVELRALLERYGALAYEPSEEERAAQQAACQDEGCEPPLDDDGNLVVADPAEGTWSLTEAGAAFLDGDPMGARTRELMAKDAAYVPVYRELLAFVSQRPRSKSDIDQVIDAHPLVQNPRLFSGYFLGELERIDAMEWDGAWRITKRGSALLADLSADGEDEAACADEMDEE
ncbi:hypothetical protein BN3658_01500 [Coriobacteriaceae bacterium CHKCI002]|nr:hypothetical protein BN3658_01500 [Coriobacteriaceae bacterium CHKCI002]